MIKTALQIGQIDEKIKPFSKCQAIAAPPAGWIRSIRTAIGMSMEQLGKRLSVTRQAVLAIEKREKEGSITLQSLRETARAMNLKLIYALVPEDGSLELLIENRATELATRIVMRTSNTMKLEDQANSPERIRKAIKERATVIRNETPRMLWD